MMSAHRAGQRVAVFDAGPQQVHGTLANLPTRGVVGAHWSGRQTCWRHAPQDNAAIHFHDDDLDDCRWQSDLSLTVPVYVLPRRDGPHAKVAWLAARSIAFDILARRFAGD